jgi:hypothetical protein
MVRIGSLLFGGQAGSDQDDSDDAPDLDAQLRRKAAEKP